MSLLDHPDAQSLLADAVLTPEAVRGCEGRLAAFLGRYLPRFRRAEQRRNAALVVRGLLGGLRRKTCEPIAVEAGVHRKPIQFLVGAGKWDDEAVMAELRRHVAEELGDDRAVLAIDATTFPKSGADSCGVGRQWCGRLGKQENCQRGIFLAYAAPGGYAPLDRRLYLPKDWAGDPARRAKCHVPEDVEFREGWRIAAELIERSGPGLPHAWVVGDDEFGRPAQFRAWLRGRGERYVLDVPGDTIVRDLECAPPPGRRPGRGRPRTVPFRRVDAWAAALPAGRWTRLTIRAGEKGPLRVDAMAVRVRTRLEHRVGPEERLVVMRTVEAEPETHYALSDAAADVPLEELVRARFARHRIEEVFEAAKGEVGLAQYEVRGWVGWHHHVTLSLLAPWFLCCERRRVGGGKAGGDGVAGARGLHATAARPGAEPGADRGGGHAGAAAVGQPPADRPAPAHPGALERRARQVDHHQRRAPLPRGPARGPQDGLLRLHGQAAHRERGPPGAARREPPPRGLAADRGGRRLPAAHGPERLDHAAGGRGPERLEGGGERGALAAQAPRGRPGAGGAGGQPAFVRLRGQPPRGRAGPAGAGRADRGRGAQARRRRGRRRRDREAQGEEGGRGRGRRGRVHDHQDLRRRRRPARHHLAEEVGGGRDVVQVLEEARSQLRGRGVESDAA